MAVRLDTSTAKTDSLHVSERSVFQYEKDEPLHKNANTLYVFSPQTHSMIKMDDLIFKPVCIHVTTMLHKGLHESELVVEHHVEGEKNTKLFLCFPMSKKETITNLRFPLKESPLEKIMQTSHNDFFYYKTISQQDHVFFSSQVIGIGDEFPKVLNNSKAKYKDIFEPNSFNIMNQLKTRNDSKIKRVRALSGKIRFQKSNNDMMEGFTDSYMECELLAQDKEGNELKMSEYALTPLNANYYERGLVTFITSLHFLLIIFVGGFIFPYFQSHCKSSDSHNSLWYYVFTFVHYAFLIVSVTMMSVGLSNVRKSKKKGKTNRKVIATVGLYFLFLFISNAVGMALQFPTSDLYNENFVEMPNYSWFNRAFNPLMKIKDDEPSLST